MRLTCSACQAEQSLEAMVGREADARALAAFIEGNVPLGAVLVRYIALFRPAKRRLSLARTVALFDELQPDLARGAITRKGRDWSAPPELWRAAIDQVLANRDKGALTLPLTGHGYLYEVILGMADKAEGQAERAHIDQARGRAPAAGPVSSAVAVAHVAQAVTGVQADGSFTTAPAPAAPLPYDAAKGPSRAARETKARMQAALRARQGGADDEGDAP